MSPYGPYEGICYDGPHEGRFYRQEYRRFKVALYDPPHILRYADHMPLEHVSIKTAEYVWSPPLRKWVFRP